MHGAEIKLDLSNHIANSNWRLGGEVGGSTITDLTKMLEEKMCKISRCTSELSCT